MSLLRVLQRKAARSRANQVRSAQRQATRKQMIALRFVATIKQHLAQYGCAKITRDLLDTAGIDLRAICASQGWTLVEVDEEPEVLVIRPDTLEAVAS